MDKIKMIIQKFGKVLGGINKLSLPTTILIASMVLGGFYFATQVSKQNSIEKQQIELQAKQDQESRAKSNNDLQLDSCLTKAQQDRDDSATYWLDWEKKTCGNYSGTYYSKCVDAVLAEIKKVDIKLQQDKDNCIKLYK
jgi:hypothetical protein